MVVVVDDAQWQNSTVHVYVDARWKRTIQLPGHHPTCMFVCCEWGRVRYIGSGISDMVDILVRIRVLVLQGRAAAVPPILLGGGGKSVLITKITCRTSMWTFVAVVHLLRDFF